MTVPRNAAEARLKIIHAHDLCVCAGMVAYEGGDTEGGQMCDQAANVANEALALHDKGDYDGAAMLLDTMLGAINSAHAMVTRIVDEPTD